MIKFLVPTTLCGATLLAFGTTLFTLATSPDGVKLLSFALAFGALALNVYNNNKVFNVRLQLAELEIFRAKIVRNQEMIEAQRKELEHDKAEQLKQSFEIAQISAEVLNDKGSFKHRGRWLPLSQPPSPTDISVLIADDDAYVNKMLARVLTYYGFNVETRESAIQAEQLIKQRKLFGKQFDFVIVDMRFPDGSGMEVVDAADHTVTHVLVMTGSPDTTLHKLCTDKGAKAVLIKPIEAEELLALLGCYTSTHPRSPEA